jgi:hypothetical protein
MTIAWSNPSPAYFAASAGGARLAIIKHYAEPIEVRFLSF